MKFFRICWHKRRKMFQCHLILRDKYGQLKNRHIGYFNLSSSAIIRRNEVLNEHFGDGGLLTYWTRCQRRPKISLKALSEPILPQPQEDPEVSVGQILDALDSLGKKKEVKQ